MFKESAKCVFKKILLKVSRMYQESLKFLLQFCCMNLIAATRAEGGLVKVSKRCFSNVFVVDQWYPK